MRQTAAFAQIFVDVTVCISLLNAELLTYLWMEYILCMHEGRGMPYL